MKRMNSARRWILLAVMTAPLLATSSCISNAEKLLLGNNRNNNDVGHQVDAILGDVGNLVDSLF